MYDKLKESCSYIRSLTSLKPKIGVILGTGLGNLAEKVHERLIISYAKIPHMPQSTVKSHTGNLILGTVQQTPIAVLQGRFHYYEGYNMKEISYPVRLLKLLGIDILIISNAAGGLNLSFRAGDIVMVKDHINLMGDNPLRGVIDDRLGDRFPDLLNCYDKTLMNNANKISSDLGILLKTGVYLAVQGPSLETHAEHLFFKTAGADLVGMSTIPEVIVAKQMNMKIIVFSVVTNQCLPNEELKETSLDDVIETANRAEPNLTQLIFSLIGTLKIAD